MKVGIERKCKELFHILLRGYRAHINVEFCSTLRAIKSSNKYLTKGHDKIDLSLYDADNEIHRFRAARYMSGTEAAWQLYRFNILICSISITTLDVHTEEYEPP